MQFQGTYDLFIIRSDEMEDSYGLKITLKGLTSKDPRYEFVDLKLNESIYEKRVSFDVSFLHLIYQHMFDICSFLRKKFLIKKFISAIETL